MVPPLSRRYSRSILMRLHEPPVVRRLHVAPGRRIVALSDVHGKLDYLQGLLNRVDFSRDDVLIIVGDILEKGPDPLGTLRYIMALSERYEVHSVCGNCDFWQDFCDNEPDERMDAWYLQYLVGKNRGWGDGLIAQMLHILGIPIAPDMDLTAAKDAVREAFVPEFAFLRALPHIIETEDYVFVHSAYLPERGAFACMKTDRYRDLGRKHEKWTIVGHWPVVLYGGDTTCAQPIIDRETRLVSIDGGCVLKDDGQLNALLLPSMECVSYDRFPVRRVRDTQRESERHYYIRYGDNRAALLGTDGEFCRVRHVRTGYEMDVLRHNLLREENGLWLLNDCTDYRMALSPGDEISVVRETSRGIQCKFHGISGWYDGKLE